MDIKKQIHTKLSTINDSIVSNLIFTFIKDNNIAYSENKNGIFFNVSLLDDKLANELLRMEWIFSRPSNVVANLTIALLLAISIRM